MKSDVEVEVEFLEVETNNALQIKARTLLLGGDKIMKHWIPISQISYKRKMPDKTGVIHIPKWLAENKGLDYDEKD